MSHDRSFGSDNHSGVHPQILAAILAANTHHAHAYGGDIWSETLRTSFRREVHPKAEVFLVFNGTAANVLALSVLLKSYEAVICSDVSHLHVDECAAPEFHFGGKLLTVVSQSGKMRAADMEKLLTRLGDQHSSQPKMVSISQPTELGTVYSIEEMREIHHFCRKHKLFLHVDGARLANAAVHLRLSLNALVDHLQPDALSFGGTKNGLMGVEALLFFSEEHATAAKFLRKQFLQLPSKTRFLAAQFEAYLTKGLWQEIAAHSLQMAKKLAEELGSIRQIQIAHPVESNAVFARIPKVWTKELRDQLFFYVWNENEWLVRLMTSFDTTDQDITRFVTTARKLGANA